MTTSRTKLEQLGREYATSNLEEQIDGRIEIVGQKYDPNLDDAFQAGARAVIEMLRSPEATEELFVPRLGQHENHAMAKWLEQQLGAPHE